ncbi:MAG: type II secretion system protein GspN [Myxococcota bacterium]|nr:type II secretion system protein GspN [Myxococcota bacterium]
MTTSAENRIPRWLVLASYPVAALVLILFFIFLGFPYNQLAVRIGQIVESRMDIQMRIGDLSPHVGLGGPGLAASQVVARMKGRQPVALERLVLRPGWSLSWFRAKPAIHLDITSELGDGSGTLTVGNDWGWDGTLEHVALDLLPLDMLKAFALDGTLDATIDLQRTSSDTGSEFVGMVEFDLRDGSFSTQGIPLAIPFESLHGRLDFGGEAYISLSGVALEGPLLDGTIEGSVGRAAPPAGQAISLDVAFRPRDEGLASLLRGIAGVGEDGRSHLQISGTVAQPVVR